MNLYAEPTVMREDWHALTRDESKIVRYSEEFFFRESLLNWQMLVGESWAETCATCALVVVRPEAILEKKVDTVISSVERRGFLLVAIEGVNLSPLTSRVLWAHQWNITTLDRAVLVDYVNSAAKSVLMVFIDTKAQSGLRGSTRLTYHKGTSLPHERRSNHIRSEIGAKNHIFCSIHAADEPIDVIREIGVLASRDQQASLINSVVEMKRPDYRPLVEHIYASISPCRFDMTSCLAVLRAKSAEESPPSTEALNDVLDCAEGTTELDIARLSKTLSILAGTSYFPNVLYVLSERVACKVPGAKSYIASESWKLWYEGDSS